MGSYVARRMMTLVLVLLGMSIITFAISHVIPIDPAASAAGMEASPEIVERIRKELGLDQPLTIQYLSYVRGILLDGDFGYSILNRRPVLDDILRFAPASVELALFSLMICVPAGLIFGVITATGAGGVTDAVVRIIAVVGVAMPVFWLALLMQVVFYWKLGWLPDGGRLGIEFSAPPAVTRLYLIDSLIAGRLDILVDTVRHLLLPGLTLAMANVAVITRMTRSSLLEVLHQDYIRTARAKGLAGAVVMTRHALKNAMVPVVTVIGLQLGYLIAWVFLVETIFSWPGIGSYAIRAIVNLDFPAVQGVTLFTSLVFVLINLGVDVIYLFLDPRITY
jgi:peptide/nickel transport system permease protein